jgi:DNA invertase Pin-like site-specific DNA recombinase
MDARLQLVDEIRQHVYQHGLDAGVERYSAELERWPGEPAGIWLRVSSSKQDEANQLPDVLEYCARRNYRPARWYILHDKSAKKGEQQDTLDEMVNDMRHGAIVVGVCWKASRMERRGPRHTFRLLTEVSDAGCRVESVSQQQWGTGGVAGQTLTSLYASIDQEYSDTLSDNVKLSYDRIRSNGGVGPGGTPWGYKVTGEKYNKRLVATDLCGEYAPKIFQQAIDRESYRAIAEWLDSQGVPPKGGGQWHEGSVRKLIHNPVYKGRWMNEARTRTIARSEVVVSPDVWDRANAATTRQPGRRPVTNHALLADLKCKRCEDSPMNVIRIKDRNGKYYSYYRCTGRGARRKGCGNMIPLEPLERIARLWMLVVSSEPHQERYWIEGTNWDSEISDAKQDMREALEAEEFGRLPELQAKLEDYRNREVTKGRWGPPKDTGITKGEYFAGLDHDAKRDYLRTLDIRAIRLPKGEAGGWGAGKSRFKLFVDGEECDPERFAAADAARVGRLTERN